jgi:hypothetical protein
MLLIYLSTLICIVSILIVQSENKSLQQSAERLEMELLYMRAADVNGGVGSDEDGECEEDGGVYKQRYERTVRELEFTRRRLQQQHEDDLEQLVGLKKQLEKKVLDSPVMFRCLDMWEDTLEDGIWVITNKAHKLLL